MPCSRDERKLLLISTNERLHSELTDLLGEEGYRVSIAEPREETLKGLQAEEEFDLVLLSLDPRSKDRLEILDFLLDCLPDIPIILLTREEDIDLAREGITKGAYDYVAFPLNSIDFLAAIRRGVEKRVLLRELALRADTDPLTGIPNRAVYESRIQEVFQEAFRYGNPLSVLFIDIDNFKSVNDLYGHLAGDLYLKAFASLIRNNIRKADLLARYGGEEFVVLMPQTNAHSALCLARRLQSLVSSFAFDYQGEGIQKTISIGIASFPEGPIKGPEDFLLVADKALYEAKKLGRNRISIG